MTGYRLTRQADDNLIQIYLQGAEQFGIRQADRYTSGLERSCSPLAGHPRMGCPADEIRAGLRRHEHAAHVVFYRETGDGVLIVAILHRRMLTDLDADEQ